jgi:hypothetical protein
MVPDFSPDDSRYHDGVKCGSFSDVLLDGEPIQYTHGVFDGPEGWVLYAGFPTERVHSCPNDPGEVCVEPRFGRVEVGHTCRP